MTYDITQAMGVNVTYGILIEQVTSGGPASTAGLKAGTTQATIDGNTINLGGDIVIGINGVRVRDGDDLSSYLRRVHTARTNCQPNDCTKQPNHEPISSTWNTPHPKHWNSIIEMASSSSFLF